MLARALLASLFLTLPTAALATPVSIELSGLDDGASADAGTFATTGGSCSTSTTRGSCGGGYTGVSGSLDADLAGDVLSGLSGAIHIDGLGTLDVTDGVLDLSGGDESFLTTDFGTFHFGSVGWYGGGSFWGFGGNWSGYCNSWGCKRFWLRLRGYVDDSKDEPGTQVPEPSAALLFGVGALVVSQRARRRKA